MLSRLGLHHTFINFDIDLFAGWVLVRNKDGSVVERDDLIGEFVFKNDDDEEYKSYIHSMRKSERVSETGTR